MVKFNVFRTEDRLEPVDLKVIAYRPPTEEITFEQFLLSKLPGFCSYCGQWYIRWQEPTDDPLRRRGRCCPHGHEGYIDFIAPDGARAERMRFNKVIPRYRPS